MLKNFISIVLLSIFTQSLQELQVCDKLPSASETQFCKVSESVVYPPPYYTIQPVIDILDISEINEDKKTITVYLKLFLGWNDTAIRLYLSGNDFLDDGGWFNIYDTKNPNEILRRAQSAAKIINCQSLEKTKMIDVKNSLGFFWHQEPFFKLFEEDFKVTLSCNFDFLMFPFDKHQCYLKFINPYYEKDQAKFTPTSIYVKSSSTNLTDQPLLIKDHKLPYEISVASIPTGQYFLTKYTHATTGIVFNLERNDIGQLIGGFFWPTGIFTIISLVSFLIDPDVVPGRMGLLLSVFLIITNNYNSINAPADRGFSFIEIWMVGIYLQILFAIFEYSYLIVQNRNKVMAMDPNEEHVNIKKLSNQLDQNSIIFSLIYFILFQCTYWLIVIFYV